MRIIALMALLIIVTFLHIYFSRKTQNNMGSNIGEKYMKDQWGIDEKEK